MRGKETETDRQTETEDRQTDRQTDRRTDGRTDGQTDRDRQRQRQRQNLISSSCMKLPGVTVAHGPNPAPFCSLQRHSACIFI